MSKACAYIQLIRPKHWVKNLLIFAPLFFVGDILNTNSLIKGIHLFIVFSLLASSVYTINDIADKESDKLHPKKKNRPIAAGRITSTEAMLLTGTLLIAAILLSLSLPTKATITLGIYVIINLLYSFWLKHLVIVDIFIIASMYLLRIFAGGKLWNIHLSQWIILCTFFLALFLISAKRRAEFNAQGGEKATTRKVMQSYNKDFLDHSLTITTTATLVTYSLYVVSIQKPYIIYSLFIVTFGILRYLYLAYRYNIGQSPEQIIFKDPWILITILIWITYNGFIFYYI